MQKLAHDFVNRFGTVAWGQSWWMSQFFVALKNRLRPEGCDKPCPWPWVKSVLF